MIELVLPRRIAAIFDEPVVIEIVLALIVTALIAWTIRRLLRIAHRLDQRRALREFVRGMDHFLRGEHEAATTELEKVLERDPENVEARIALGDALRELGRPADAHRHHYHVRKVFGHELSRNDLSLGRDLLALGDPEGAVPELERAIERGATNGTAVRELRDACLATGRWERAIDTGRTVFKEAVDEDAREDARRTLARALTQGATAAIEGGSPKSAVSLLEEAIGLAPELVQARMELVRGKLVSGGDRSGARAFAEALREMRRLAAEGGIVFEPLVGGPAPQRAASATDDAAPGVRALPGGETRLLDAPEPDARPASGPEGEVLVPALRPVEPTREVVVRSEAVPALPEDVLAPEDVEPLLARAARAFCDLCGRTARDWAERCPGCGAYGSMRPRNTTRLQPIRSPREVLEEIEESRGYVRRLCRQLAAGQESAAVPLQRVGRRAVPMLFREALSVGDARPLVACLARMGPSVLPDLLESWRRTRSILKRRVFGDRARRRSADEIVVATLVRMPGQMETLLRDLLERPEPEVRLLGLDTMLRTGRQDLIEEARLLFSSKDIVARLNELPTEVVTDVVEGAAADSHLAKVVFPDRTFEHDEALVEALVRARDREKVVGILRARGFVPDVVTALLRRADRDDMRELVLDLIQGYGPAASDHLLTAVVDPEMAPETRKAVADLLRSTGVTNVEKLLDGAVDRPGTLADGVLELIGEMGEDAVPELRRAYASGGWLSKIGLGREKIHLRRRLIIRSLTRLGGEAATMALREIRMRETDPGLRREAEASLEQLGGN